MVGVIDTKWRAIQLGRRVGWDVRRFNPFATLEDFLCRIVFPSFDVNCVFDVGAHVGEYAIGLRNRGYRGHIVSFEPVAESYEILRERAAADPMWSAVNVALGRRNETAVINVMRGTTFSSLRAPLTDGVEDFVEFGNVVDHTETVQVRRLDEVFSEVTREIAAPNVFLKMDTQGWDLDVLAGCGTSLSCVVGLQSELSIRPLYEAMPDYREAIDSYEDHGFVISSLYPVGRDRQLDWQTFDCVMVALAGWRGIRP